MKPLKNLSIATVFDTETDGLRFEASKIHILSFKMKGKSIQSIPGTNTERLKAFFTYHIDNEIPVVAHNGICYDVPVMEELLGIDLSELIVIDTLPISWYLNINRVQHGLGTFHEDYGIEKPPVDDWVNVTYEQMEKRCSSDVAINAALWEDLLSRLEYMYGYVKEEVDKPEFGGQRITPDEVLAIDSMKGNTLEQYICNCLDYLMSIMFTYRVQEDYGLTLDIPYIEESLAELHEKVNVIKDELEKAMPKIPKYTKKTKPKVMFKKNGDLSAAGLVWEEVKKNYSSQETDEHGTRLVLIGKNETTITNDFGEEFSRPVDDIEEFQVFKEYDAPNANSPGQVKDMLFLHGWVPCTFKDVKDKAAENEYRKAMDAWRAIKGRKPPRPEKPEVRQVEQVSVKGDDGGKELTPSVLALAEKVPAIKLYADYNLYRHRIGVLEGFLKNRDCRGKIVASIGGFTSTLRQKHRGIVNLPGVMAAYGKNIRGAIIADKEDEIMLGSDLSSLESVLGFHFMLPLDPDYVQEMLAPDWDSHLATALAAGLITQKEFDDYKNGIKPDHVTLARKQAKTANYACLPVGITEILTEDGWKKYEDLSVEDKYYGIEGGDEIITEGLNNVFIENKEVVKIVSIESSYSTVSTWDHRWLTVDGEYVTTEDLVSRDDITVVIDSQSTIDSRYLVEAGRYYSDVFCITTNTSNFKVRQRGCEFYTGNCQYGAGAEAIAKGAGIPMSLGQQLHTGYWEKNWSIKEIAASQVVINYKEKQDYEEFGYNRVYPTWLINPINGIAYELRKDGDRFSALIQGLGSFVENRWIMECFKEQKERFGRIKCQGNCHDEQYFSVKNTKTAQNTMEGILKDSLSRVNDRLLLRKRVECDVQFGKSYADIH